jgi:hypothetical protein
MVALRIGSCGNEGVKLANSDGVNSEGVRVGEVKLNQVWLILAAQRDGRRTA